MGRLFQLSFWRLSIWAVAGAALFTIVLIRVAWCAEDAFISFRVVDNFLQGHGLTWNAGDRVQVFTDPLFQLLTIAGTFILRSNFWSAMAASFLLSLLTYFFLMKDRETPAVLLGTALLLSSNGFVDFSASGLENPATHCAIAAYVYVYWRRRDPFLLTLIAALSTMNRMDSVLLFAPSLAWLYFRSGWRVWKPVALGLIPILAWEAFSVFYYGFPFPNTAYAKLNTGLSTHDMLGRGLNYLTATATLDTATAVGLAAGLVVGFAMGEWQLALGVLLSIAYIMRVGGDYMLSRFFTPAFVLCCAIVLQHAPRSLRNAALCSVAVVLIGLQIPSPTLLAFHDITLAPMTEKQLSIGIVDEARVWYPATGLLNWRRGGSWPQHPLHWAGDEIRQSGVTFFEFQNAGIPPYYSGTKVYILDRAALCDALMAHAPLKSDTARPGHPWRVPPPGYIETLKTGENRIQDPYLAEYYSHLKHIIRGSLWDFSRWGEILAMNTGRYDHLLAQSSGYDKVAAR